MGESHRDTVLLSLHEAGHAIAGHRRGYVVQRVEIRPRRGSGFCESLGPARPSKLPLQLNYALQRVEVLLAGGAAEAIWHRQQGLPMTDDALAEAWGGDLAEVQQHLDGLGVSQAFKWQLFQDAYRRVLTELSEPAVWAKVERVAERLREQGTLTGKQVGDVVGGSCSNSQWFPRF